MEPSWVSAIAAVVGVGITTFSIWRSSVQFRRSTELSSRPYVVVSFEVLPRDKRLYFKIANSGKSLATNITIDFGPELGSGESSPYDFGASLRNLFSDPGITLGPGESKQTIYRSPMNATAMNEVVTPDVLTGTLSYSGPAKFNRKGEEKRRGQRYIEPFTLDYRALKHLTVVVRSDHDVEQRLKAIGGELRKLRSTLDRLASSFSRDD